MALTLPNLTMTTDVEDICDFLSAHTNLQNYLGGSGSRGVGGINLSPGLGICNKAQQFLFMNSKNWKFNRSELSGPPSNPTGNFFVTQYGVQDILHAGACAFSTYNTNNPSVAPSYPAGGVGIDLVIPVNNGGTPQAAGIVESGGTVTVQTLQQHPFSVGMIVYLSGCTQAIYNAIFTYNNTGNNNGSIGSNWTNGFVVTAVPDPFHFSFATQAGQSGINSGAPGITDWERMESAYLTDINSLAFPQTISKIEAVDRIAPAFTSNNDLPSVCMLLDQNNGILKFRMSEPWGTYPYQVNCVYQSRPPVLTGVDSVFAWPDQWRAVLEEIALWMAYRFAKGASSEEAQFQYKIAFSMIQQAMAADDVESSGEAIVPARGIMN